MFAKDEYGRPKTTKGAPKNPYPFDSKKSK